MSKKTMGVPDDDDEGGGEVFMPGMEPVSKGPSYRFVIPEKVRQEGRDPRFVYMRELDNSDMATVRALAAKTKGKSTGEFIAAALALTQVDERQVNHAESEGEQILGRCSPKVRALIQLAFAKIHTTDDEEDAAFLSSMTVR